MKKICGFTLIELLIVVGIIAIISTIGLVLFSSVQAKARDDTRKNNLSQLAAALEIHFQKNWKYIEVTDGNCSIADSTKFYSEIRPYLSGEVPTDPSGSPYCYVSVNTDKAFRLFTRLEKCNDSGGNLCDYSHYNYSVYSNNLPLAQAPGDTLTPSPAPTVTPTASPTSAPTPSPTTLLARRQGAADATPTTLTIPINSSADDTYTDNDSFNNPASAALTVGNNGKYDSGLKFSGVNIPSGATIISAYLQVKMQYNRTAVTDTIYGEATGNASDFSGGTLVDLRPKTTNNVRWSRPAGLTDEEWYNSPSIRDIVQEIVNRDDWAAGNALAIIIKGNSDLNWSSFYSFDSSADNAPELIVTYQ